MDGPPISPSAKDSKLLEAVDVEFANLLFEQIRCSDGAKRTDAFARPPMKR